MPQSVIDDANAAIAAEDAATAAQEAELGNENGGSLPANMGFDSFKLSNLNTATINPAKLTDYALNPLHPSGQHKARVFQSALGYNQANAADLQQQIIDGLPTGTVVLGRLDMYGQRYTVELTITGPNGKSAVIVTGWIIRPNNDHPDLVTVYVK